MNKKLWINLFVAALVAAGAGCKSSPKPIKKWGLQLERASDLQNVAVEVDVIGANEQLKKDLEGESVTSYFAPNNDLRNSVRQYRKTFLFPAGEAGSKPQILPATDELWTKWRNNRTKYFVIIANLPTQSAPSGNYDPRRRIIPFDTRSYPEAKKKKLLGVKLWKARIEVIPEPVVE